MDPKGFLEPQNVFPELPSTINKQNQRIILELILKLKQMNTLLAFVGICLSEWPQLSHRLLWFLLVRELNDG